MIATNTTAGKPKLAGSIFRAPLGTPLPTDSASELNSAFVEIGYCSEDGLTNNNTRESDNIKAWGGDTVLVIQTSKDDTFGMTWIEALNVETLKAVHGDDNVTGSLATGINIKVNSKEPVASSYVIDMILRDDAIKRIVIPNAKISEVGEVTYSDNDVVGYPVTLECMTDEEGNTHYEYIIRKSVTEPTVSAVSQTATLFETAVSQIQANDVRVSGGAITGTLHYLDDGPIADHWGAGNFIALQFDNIAANATSILVGLEPSESSGLVEIIDDPDKNGVFKITNKDTQVFRVQVTDGTNTYVTDYNLKGLTCEA